MGFTLFELMQGRYVVWASEARRMVGTWNGSLTVQIWTVSNETFLEAGLGTLESVPGSVGDAERDLREHFEL